MKQNLEDEVSRDSYRYAEENAEGNPFPFHDAQKKEKEEEGDGDKTESFHEKGVEKDGSADEDNFQEIHLAKDCFGRERLTPAVGPRPRENNKRQGCHQDACPKKKEAWTGSTQGPQPHAVGFNGHKGRKDEPEGSAYPVCFTHSVFSRETGVAPRTKFQNPTTKTRR